MKRPEHNLSLYKIMCLTVLALSVPSGCTVGPDYVRPSTPAEAAESFVNSPARLDPNDVAEISQWWQRLGDPVIADLVRSALRNNTDLKAATARVVEARALLAQSHGIRLPEVLYSGGRVRTKISFISPFGKRESFISTTYFQDISINYIVDFFGKLKRAEQAALADMLATEAAQQTLMHTIIAQVVRSRIQITTLQRLLHIAQANIESWRDALQIVERRYSAGLVGPLDVYLARENIAASQALEPQLRQSLALARHSLDVLTGRRPATSEPLAETLPDLPSLEPVPVGVPAALLDRRPDVRAAELRLAAATERIGVSIAGLFPDLTLTAIGGFRSDTLSDIIAREGEVYSAVIGLAAPIFKGGRLRAQVDAARARADQAAANYAGVVLLALREVEDALVRERMLRQRLDQLEKRLTEAFRAESLARQRYLRGVEKILIVLETERRRRIAENELTETRGELWNARIDLFLALGGDWEVSSAGQENESPEHAGPDNLTQQSICRSDRWPNLVAN